MKKFYTKPQFTVVDVVFDSVMTTSTERLPISNTPGTFDASSYRSRSADWENYDGVMR